MLNPGNWIGHWGYLAIVLGVFGGNVGLPVPEETILVLGGYMAWRGTLRLPIVLAVGILSATAGDNLGYWLGRRYGSGAIERYGRWLWLTEDRLKAVRDFVSRYGAFGVFAARFIPGLRFAAGPLAGAIGLRVSPFVLANALGAACYVPLAVGAGYALGYGFGEYVEQLRRVLGEVEHAVLIGVGVATLGVLGWRMVRGLHARDRDRRRFTR